MGQVFQNLNKVSIEFNNSINEENNRALDNLYATYNNVFMSLGNKKLFNSIHHRIGVNVHEEGKFIQDNLCDFWQYNIKYNASLKDVTFKFLTYSAFYLCI